jgi:acetyl-CoA carboxylase biotin carboxylase subunit
MTTGLDLVEAQIRVAQGETLPFRQSEIACRGHAFECRINAEDPKTFVPSPGVITRLEQPGGPGVRVDTHASSGYRVPPYYDSLIGKLVVHGATRAEALARLKVALDEMQVEGIATNLPLHCRLVDDAEFVRGGVSIHYLENRLKQDATL